MSSSNKDQAFITVFVDTEPYKVIREVLFKHGLSFQEFVNGLIKKMAGGDHYIELVEEIKEKKANKQLERFQKDEMSDDRRISNPNELFNILEKVSPLNPR